MGQTTSERTRGGGQNPNGGELMRLKLELVAAREQGERGALTRILTAHPQHVAELTQFAASLVATSSYEHEMPTPEMLALTERARERAFAAVFPAATVTAPAGGFGARATATLKALRKARGLSLGAAARHLGLGLDVLQNLEAGLIRATSVPDRLTRALGDLLETTAEQVRAALPAQPLLEPALQRTRAAAEAETPVLNFEEAIHLSPTMTAEQKERWLGE